MKKRILLPLIALLPVSCTFFKLVRSSKLKQPDVAYVRCELKGVSESQADVDFILSAYNPNAIGLKNVAVDYELFSEGKRFLQGQGIRLELPPKDTTRIVVPAAIIYSEILNALGPAADAVLFDKKTIPVRIDAVIKGNPTVYNEVEEGSLFSFSLKISRTEAIPLPQKDIKRAKSAVRNAIKKLF